LFTYVCGFGKDSLDEKFWCRVGYCPVCPGHDVLGLYDSTEPEISNLSGGI